MSPSHTKPDGKATMKQELFDIIKDPIGHRHHKADQQIRAELVKIKTAIDNIDQMVYDLATSKSVTDTIQGKTSDIEQYSIEIADELDEVDHQ
tara:strand:+ start:143 stop:421 length:279 start_codon:yes stop_codon:yes gene_type:complete